MAPNTKRTFFFFILRTLTMYTMEVDETASSILSGGPKGNFVSLRKELLWSMTLEARTRKSLWLMSSVKSLFRYSVVFPCVISILPLNEYVLLKKKLDESLYSQSTVCISVLMECSSRKELSLCRLRKKFKPSQFCTDSSKGKVSYHPMDVRGMHLH